MSQYPPCLRAGCGHTAWAHGTQTGTPRWDEPCHSAATGNAECPCHGYVGEHQPLVWGPAAEGEKTISGGAVPAGWVWTCTCGRSGVGLASEDAAGTAADEHIPATKESA